MAVETVTQKHAATMLKQPKTAVRRDTIDRLQNVSLAAVNLLNSLPRNGPVLHAKEVAINTRAFSLMQSMKELQTLVGTLERE